jgi:hypothetical protein
MDAVAHFGELEGALDASQSAADDRDWLIRERHDTQTPVAMKKKKRVQRDVLPVANVLQSLLGDGKSALSDQFLRWRLWHYWADVVGATIGKSSEPVGYRFGKLTLWVRSSARLQEMRFMEVQIRERVNAYLGREFVKAIVLTLDRHSVPAADQVSSEFKKYLE